MYRFAALVTVVALLLVSTAAFAQYTTAANADYGIPGFTTARYMGMGSVGVAAADDVGAINYNPANLASLDIAPPAGLSTSSDVFAQPWSWQAAGTLEVDGDLDYRALHFAGSDSQAEWGFGASWHSTDSPSWMVADWWLAGIGARLGSSNWQWGISVMDGADDFYGDETTFNVGFLYNWQQQTGEPVRIGFTVDDLTDEYQAGPFFNVGIAWPISTCECGPLLLSADLLDATDEYETLFNVGFELKPLENWAFRGGRFNNDLYTAGVGYESGAWEIDVSWQEAGPSGLNDEFAATASHSFK